MNIMRSLSLACAIPALAATAMTAQPTSAQAAADFYTGKNLTLVVGFSVGGGGDTFARFFARHLSKHMPGAPNVIVQNMPGAGGIKALNFIYNTEPQDGSRIILTSPSHTLGQFLGEKAVKYDLTRMKWLGTLTQDTSSCAASGKSGFTSIAQAKDRELIVGATGPSSSTSQHPLLLANLLGYKIKLVYGYQGTSRVRLAMETGEVQAVCAFWASQATGPQKQDVATGKLVPIVQMGNTPHPAFGKAPVAYDLARNDEERRIMRAVFRASDLSRPTGAPPGTPADRLALLREGFWKAATSAEIKTDAAKSGLLIDPLNWQETEKALAEILGTPKPLVERAKQVIKAK